MEQKYYTPDISEFHVGFEYETKTISSHDEWIPVVIASTIHTESLCGTYIDDWELELVDTDETRVKYLDRKDVESLGWSVRREPYRWQFFKDNYYLSCDMYTSTDPFPKGSIKIIDRKDDQCIFLGYIKNKSELKRLMQQLNIL
jgi:hypothetical protein